MLQVSMPTLSPGDGSKLSTRFLELSLDLPISCHHSQSFLRERIETALQSYGEPLRWAITAVDPTQSCVHIEAVVTQLEVDP
jgi:hypothetical protein